MNNAKYKMKPMMLSPHMILKKITPLFLIGLLSISLSSHAATTLVAVSSNFSKPMLEIADEFKKATGHIAQLSFGASGKFVSQIQHGAPFDVFLAADDKNTGKLKDSGLIVDSSRFTYALGKLVLWSNMENYVDEKGEILAKVDFRHIAVADPKLAPYGAAAIDVLKNKNLLDKLQPLFVVGENISQTHQFISTGNAELGFLALSQVSENGKITIGSGWIVPKEFYIPIKQEAVLLTLGTENTAARALLDYLKSSPAKNIIRKYGYDLPN